MCWNRKKTEPNISLVKQFGTTILNSAPLFVLYFRDMSISVPYLFAVWLRHVLCCILVPLFVCRGTRRRFCAGAPFNLHQCQLCLACPGPEVGLVPCPPGGMVAWKEGRQKVDTGQGQDPSSMGDAAAPCCLSEKTNRKIGFRSQLVKHVPKPGFPGLTLERIFEEIVAHLVASRFLPIPASLFQNIYLPT